MRPCSTRFRLRRHVDHARRSERQPPPSTARNLPAFCSPVPETPRLRRPGGAGRKPRSVSIRNPACSRCIRKYPGATTLTIIRTLPACRSRTAPQGDRHRSRQNRDGDLRGQPDGASRGRSEPVCAHRGDEGERTRQSRMAGAQKIWRIFGTRSIPSRRDGPASLCVWSRYAIGAAGRGALVAAVRSEQPGRCRSCQTDEFLRPGAIGVNALSSTLSLSSRSLFLHQ